MGFSLVELIVVVAIVGVLASIGLPLAELAQKRNKEEELRYALRQIRDALDAYKAAGDQGHFTRTQGDSGYPPDLSSLVNGIADAQSPKGGKLYFLRNLPSDPFAQGTSSQAEDTWATRSYNSPPDAPEPGKDVYDIHSKSKEVGLNGVPYNRW